MTRQHAFLLGYLNKSAGASAFLKGYLDKVSSGKRFVKPVKKAIKPSKKVEIHIPDSVRNTGIIGTVGAGGYLGAKKIGDKARSMEEASKKKTLEQRNKAVAEGAPGGKK
jgi:hypothetical protein